MDKHTYSMGHLKFFIYLLQDACQILVDRLEPTRKDNPNIPWKELVKIFLSYHLHFKCIYLYSS